MAFFRRSLFEHLARGQEFDRTLLLAFFDMAKELLGFIEIIAPCVFPMRLARLFHAVKHHDEACTLLDGKIGESLQILHRRMLIYYGGRKIHAIDGIDQP